MMMKVKMKMNTKIEMKCGYEDGLGTRSNSVWGILWYTASWGFDVLSLTIPSPMVQLIANKSIVVKDKMKKNCTISESILQIYAW